MALRYCFFLICWCWLPLVQAQFQMSGKVVNQRMEPIANADVMGVTQRMLQKTNRNGEFVLNTVLPADTIRIQAEGYLSTAIWVEYQHPAWVQLRTDQAVPALNTLQHKWPDSNSDSTQMQLVGGESYAGLDPNRWMPVRNFPNLQMGLHDHQAAYTNIRRFLQQGRLPPPAAVRIEEMLNYLPPDEQQPEPYFRYQSWLAPCPWEPKHLLLLMALRTAAVPDSLRKPKSFVVLLDVSGSMDMPHKMPVAKAALKQLAHLMQPNDQLAILGYGGAAGIILPPTTAFYQDSIQSAINAIEPGGSTPGAAGLALAYDMAKRWQKDTANTKEVRIVLITDGDFNVGQQSEKSLASLIQLNRGQQRYLDCFGVGMGNYKDNRLEMLAKQGNGHYGYWDTEEEAKLQVRTILLGKHYTAALQTEWQWQFNPDLMKRYRLIGYNNKKGAEGQAAAPIAGGALGADQNIVLAVEIEPQVQIDAVAMQRVAKLADGRLQYLAIQDNQEMPRVDSITVAYEPLPWEKLPVAMRRAVIVMAWGLWLQQDKSLGNLTINQIKALAKENLQEQDPVSKDLLQLIDLSEKRFQQQYRRKKRPH